MLDTSPPPSAAILPPARYTQLEEITNGLIHGAALLLSIAALFFMLAFSTSNGSVWHIVSSLIYGITLILLYGASTCYHLIKPPRLKTIFRLLDHATIYLLIAGTYTPYLLINLRGPWGWSLLAMVWGIACGGIVLEVLPLKRLRRLSLALYLGLGWLVIIAAKPLLAALAPGGLALLVAGGLFYSLGTIFYVWKTLSFQHAIWHVFVVAGSLCHFFSIYLYVLPTPG